MPRRELFRRLAAGVGALVCFAGLYLVSHQIWLGLTTGRIRSKYGWMLREDRPVMFDITLGLNVLAAFLWIALAALAIWLVFPRVMSED